MNKPIDNEQAWDEWDAQIEADLKAGKLNARIESIRDEASDAHAVNKPIEYIEAAVSLYDLVLTCLDKQGSCPLLSFSPDLPDITAELELTCAMLNDLHPGQWELRVNPDNGYIDLQHVRTGRAVP